jgi:peptidoglycan/LPS O-acetylase OafA/YrhL
MPNKELNLNTGDTAVSSVHLNAMRGGAALVVLLGHTRGLFFSSLTETQAGTTSISRILIGDEAVMVFFVLSGYLVGGGVIKALRQGTWSWRSYLIKRLTRLWIVLIPALLLGTALDYTGLHFFATPTAIYAGPSQQSEVRDVSRKLSFPVIAGNAVFLQSILVSTAGTNNSLWSLANEFWYYIAFPALLLALRKKQKSWLRCGYLLAVLAIALFVGKSISMLFFIWGLGALLATVPLLAPRGTAKIISGCLLLSLPFLFVVIRRLSLPKYEAEWIVALSFAVALYFVLHRTEKARRGLYQSLASFFSRTSYTLYLVHLPLAVLLCACINTPWHQWAKSPRGVTIYLLLNASLVLVSYLFYLAFEANTDKVRHALLHYTIRAKHPSTQRSGIGL